MCSFKNLFSFLLLTIFIVTVPSPPVTCADVSLTPGYCTWPVEGSLTAAGMCPDHTHWALQSLPPPVPGGYGSGRSHWVAGGAGQAASWTKRGKGKVASESPAIVPSQVCTIACLTILVFIGIVIAVELKGTIVQWMLLCSRYGYNIKSDL